MCLYVVPLTPEDASIAFGGQKRWWVALRLPREPRDFGLCVTREDPGVIIFWPRYVKCEEVGGMYGTHRNSQELRHVC